MKLQNTLTNAAAKSASYGGKLWAMKNNQQTVNQMSKPSEKAIQVATCGHYNDADTLAAAIDAHTAEALAEHKRVLELAGQYGSLEFWIMPERKGWNDHKEYIGGVEHHYNYCPEGGWFKPDEPSHIECNLNCGKCWHDGSSLQASETFIPLLLRWGQDAVLNRLTSQYDERMKPETTDNEQKTQNKDA